jgi:hypothetical protein
MPSTLRRTFEILFVVAAALAGWRLALRAEGSLYESTSPGSEFSTLYGSHDLLSNVLTVVDGVVFVALFLVLARLEKAGTLTPARSRWLWLGIAATGVLQFAFMITLKLHHPDKF